jgi:ParB family transcriptional regulator, chromosome partitioning protein
LKTGDAPDFGTYLSSRLDELYEAYKAEKQKTGDTL